MTPGAKKGLEIGLVVVAAVAVFFMVRGLSSGAGNSGTAVVTGAPDGLAAAAVPSNPGPAPFYYTYNWPKNDPDLTPGNLASIVPVQFTLPVQPQPGAANAGACCDACSCNPQTSLLTGNLMPSEQGLIDYYNNTLKGFGDTAAQNILSSIPINITQFFNNSAGSALSDSSRIALGGTPINIQGQETP